MILNESLFDNQIYNKSLKEKGYKKINKGFIKENLNEPAIGEMFKYLKEYPQYNHQYTRPVKYYDLGLTPEQKDEFFNFLEDEVDGLGNFWGVNADLSQNIYQEGRSGGHLVLDATILEPRVFDDIESVDEMIQDELEYNYYPNNEDGTYDERQKQKAKEDVEKEIKDSYITLKDFDERVNKLITNLKAALEARIKNKHYAGFKINEGKIAKTKTIIVLQGNYGYGWDDLVEYELDDMSIKADYRDYQKNEPQYPHRLIRRRVPNPKYNVNEDLEREFTIHYNRKGFEYGWEGAVRVKAADENEAKEKFFAKKKDDKITAIYIHPTTNEDIRKGIRLLESALIENTTNEGVSYSSVDWDVNEAYNGKLTETMDKFDKLYDELVRIYLKPYARENGYWVKSADLDKIKQAKELADKMDVENKISKKEFTIDDEGTKKTKYILDMWFEEE